MPLVYSAIFTPAARAELTGAQDWYENEVPGLGRRFRAEVATIIERISVNPRQFPVVYKSIRRALLRRFPYALMLVIEADETLTVIACFHASLDPDCWQKRI